MGETKLILFVSGESRFGKFVRKRLDRHKFLNSDLEGRIKVLYGEEHPHLAAHYGVTEYPTAVIINDDQVKLYHATGWNLTRKFFRRAVNYGKLSKTRKRLARDTEV